MQEAQLSWGQELGITVVVMDVCAGCTRRDEMPQNATVRKITGESFCTDSVSILTMCQRNGALTDSAPS